MAALVLEDASEMLDECYARLIDWSIDEGMDHLFGGLLDLRERLSPDEWRAFVERTLVEHPLRELVHSDPMTRRSWEKPRGYAGDAVLLDYIYGLAQPDPYLPIGRHVYDFAVSRPAASSVRKRKLRIARLIDRVAAEQDRPIRVLSIAAGHLRELALSNAAREGGIEEFIAVDSDPESCALIEREHPGVEVRNEPFPGILRDRSLLDRFDLVYSAGLYDYLADKVATKLTKAMHSMLVPGGRLLVTNFLPTVSDLGYMESFMGWDLILRSREQIGALANAIAADEIAELRADADSERAIGYLEVQRA